VPIEWPPEFLVLPDGSACLKSDLKPCRKCGAEFVVVMTALKTCSVQCPKCVKLKPDDRVIGTIDRREWIVKRVNRPA
jgi:hypothetical protein